MKQKIIKLNQLATSQNTIESIICFSKFIEFLKEKLAAEKSGRKQFYQIVLDKLHSYPEIKKGITVNNIEHQQELLELVTAILWPLADDGDKTLLALTNAASMEVFYCTNAFCQLFTNTADIHPPQFQASQMEKLELHKQFQYSLVLKYIYGYEMAERDEIIHSFLNPQTKLYKYYRLKMDTRFIDIKIKPGMTIPDSHCIKECLGSNDNNSVIEVESLLLLSNFTAFGFCTISLTDVTTEKALDQINKSIVKIEEKAEDINTGKGFDKITLLLQTIAGSNKYKFGMMAFFYINKKVALPYENFSLSIIVKLCFDAGIAEIVFTNYINEYIQDPAWIAYPASANTRELPKSLQEVLQLSGIRHYILAPVYSNNVLIGIVEIASGSDVAPLSDQQLSKLKLTIPYISQLLQMATEKFHAAIDAIITTKFTNIQPSVQWKFNEAAWNYFRNQTILHKEIEMEKISFNGLYPLYGAVDIRNSTIERNSALMQDLEFQLQLLLKLLQQLYIHNHDDKINGLINECGKWLSKMNRDVSVEEEREVNTFLSVEIEPELAKAAIDKPSELAEKIKIFYKEIDKSNEPSHSKRKQLEDAMRKLNNAIGRYFDLFADELQLIYPCYFEKFRTDGIEYDVYIGQSITPCIPFSFEYVELARYKQLCAMAGSAKIAHSLLPLLAYPLQTTQLIFVNAHTIGISFRTDEHRFDVEGAYNIRYHTIKKRIDKVHIKDTDERLTQPGKIAIVYFNEQDITGYLSNIYRLQIENVLINDMEYFELEELQGVAGLKALRVSVVLE